MRFIRDNLARIAFAVGLLVGIQAPNLVSQYEQRVAAHLSEVSLNFSGFQTIADDYFNGDVDRLIQHHQQSIDPVFFAEAEPIRTLWRRLQHLQAEQAALAGSFFTQLIHVAIKADDDLRQETLDGYTATIPLTTAAIICGLIGAFVLAAITDALLALLGSGYNRLRFPRRARKT